MNTYYFIARDVEPKRQALAAAEAELAETNAGLKIAQVRAIIIVPLYMGNPYWSFYSSSSPRSRRRTSWTR